MIEDKDDSEVQFLSRETEELVTLPPAWMVRWGLLLILLATVFVITICSFISYPEVIVGRISLVATGSSYCEYSKNGGSIQLLERRNTVVNKGTPIIGIDCDQVDLCELRILILELNTKERNKNNSYQSSAMKAIERLNGAGLYSTTPQMPSTSDSLMYLRDRLLEWSNVHILNSPVTGRIAYSDMFLDGQIVADSTLMFCVNAIDRKFHGKAILPSNCFQQIRLGQIVRIIIDDFQMSPWGPIEGKINQISPLFKGGVGVGVELSEESQVRMDSALLAGNVYGGGFEIYLNEKSLIRVFLNIK